MFMRKVTTMLKNNSVNCAIINSVIGQMSDGIWENSRKMENIWRGLSFITEDGLITLTLDHPCELLYKDDEGVRDYIANKIKQIIKIEIDDGLKAEWDRSSNAVSDYLSRYTQPVEIRDAYQAYDILKSRKIKNPVPEQIRATELEVGMILEKYGKIYFLQQIDIEGKKYIVLKAGYNEPVLISSEAILRKRAA